ncbi:MAG: hypothetical protein AAF611_19660 [Bacteroidota bacterium]
MGLLNIILIHIFLKLFPVFTSVDGNMQTLEDVSKNNTTEVICNPEMISQNSSVNFQNIH